MEDEALPPGPLLEAADPPLEDDPLMPLLGELDEEDPPAPELLVPPVPLELMPPPGLELLELEEPGALGALDEDDEDPPGTTTVSFSFVVEDDEEGLLPPPPGTTVVVSFRSHADNDSASAPTTNNRDPLCFMSTLLSSVFVTKALVG